MLCSAAVKYEAKVEGDSAVFASSGESGMEFVLQEGEINSLVLFNPPCVFSLSYFSLE